MYISFTCSAVKQAEPVITGLCASLQSTFQELLKDIELGHGLDRIAVIVTVVNDQSDLNICRCASPVSVSSNANFVTGEKSRVLTLRPTLDAAFVMQHRADEIREQILFEIKDIVSHIRAKHILNSFDRDRFMEFMRSNLL